MTIGVVAAVAFPLLAAGASPAAPTPRGHCHVRANRAALCRFVAAVNKGAASQLLAPKRLERYIVAGPQGVSVHTRKAASVYLAARRRHSERLALTWFSYSHSARGVARFSFDLVRSADDFALPTLYRGRAELVCAKKCLLVSLTMAPSREPSLPAPQSYAETCQLAPAWCEVDPTSGGVPAELRRPLAFPSINAGGPCPVTTTTHTVTSGQFTGLVLGDGPVGPEVLADDESLGPGVFPFIALGDRGWYGAKTEWLAKFADYRGPVLIRGRQLDGPHKLVMSGDGALLVDPQLGPGDTLNGYPDGLREWPGETYLRAPGCYAWQVDGTTFGEVIVFRAVFR